MRLLVDTNVFLDLVLQREDHFKNAVDFFLWCKEKRNQIYLTSMSLRDIEYISMKTLHDKKKAQSILSDVYRLCTKVVGISADSAITAIYEDYNDFEDELIIQCAREEFVDAIITNNKKDFLNRDFPAFSPKEIVSTSSN